MKKVINASVGGRSFALDEDAYNRLSVYFDHFKARLNRDSQAARDEVMSDLESRIAELFDEGIGGASYRVIDFALVIYCKEINVRNYSFLVNIICYYTSTSRFSLTLRFYCHTNLSHAIAQVNSSKRILRQFSKEFVKIRLKRSILLPQTLDLTLKFCGIAECHFHSA